MAGGLPDELGDGGAAMAVVVVVVGVGVVMVLGGRFHGRN